MKHFALILLFFVGHLSAEESLFKSYVVEDSIVKEYLCGNDWVLCDEDRVYYNFDNQTLADYNAVLDDPLLVIRTKCGDKTQPYDLKASWYNYSKFSPFSLKLNQEGKTESVPQKMVQLQMKGGELVFDHQSPSFPMIYPKDADHVWWQISASPDFSSILPNCDQIQGCVEKVLLDRMSETFFNSDTTYYFRYRVQCQDRWNAWSVPRSFVFLRPKRVESIGFEKIGDRKFEIQWDNQEESDVRYWIFGSNAFDFVPSIYSDVELNAIVNKSVIADETSKNLITTVQKPILVVDGSLAFYRIIAEKNGCFSVPSPLIHVYDEEMSHQRTVLQRVASPVRGFAQRILFPADSTEAESECSKVCANVKPALVDNSVWQQVSPYLMPLNHPIRAKLDRMFSDKRVLLDTNSITKAGFDNAKPGMFSKAIVAEHPKMKGYFFKMFSDSQPNLVDWEQWVRRAYGANSAKASIVRLGFRNHFVVPKKWIYPLPPSPAPPAHFSQKFFILVAEKIPIEKKKKNYAKWGNMTQERLRAIVILLHTEGLVDSNRAFNLPFAKDGRNALIDLEHTHHWPVHFSTLKRWLSPSNQVYLDQLLAEIVK